MNRWWFVIVAVPVIYFVLMSLHPGVRAQPQLVFARASGRFDTLVAQAGGTHVIRTGVWIDLGFVAVTVTVSVAVMYWFGGPWWLAALAALLDLGENVLLLLATSLGATRPVMSALTVVAPVKYVAYAATIVALAVTGWRVVRGT